MTLPLSIGLLQAANEERNKHWDPTGVLGPLFFSTELAGEVGEACNVVKKLEREALGLPGSRDTLDHLGKELGDVIICACLLANRYDIDLEDFTRRAFNDKSKELNFPVLV